MMQLLAYYSVGLALAAIIAIYLDLLPIVVLCSPDHHVFPIERAFPPNQLRVDDLESVRARDRARHARMLQGVVDFSVHGSSDPFRGGIYYTKVKLGTPSREYYVQIDTGSDVMWVSCSSCSNCPITSQLGIGLSMYDAAASSTAKLVSCSDPICTTSKLPTSTALCSEETKQCGYSFQYGDGSGTSGYYVSDDFYFNIILDQSLTANSSASIIFGCSTYQSGDLVNTDKAVDGILGFGPGPMSVISQLSSRAIFPRVFSHCLKGDAEGGGAMIIGEISDPNVVYSPLVPSRPHYNLNMLSIAVNGQVLAVDPAVFATSTNKGTIVDSGTTLTYLVEEVFDPFVAAVNASVAEIVTPVIVKGTQCYLVAFTRGDVLKSFPSVSLNFDGGASMQLKPEEYLVSIGSVEGSPAWCIGFQKSEHGVSILGDLVLKDKLVVYDLAQQQIGWANYNCSVSMNMSTKFDRDKFIYNADFSASNMVKRTYFNLLTEILSFYSLFSLSWRFW